MSHDQQPLWTFKQLKRALGEPTKGVDFDISGVSIDSRTCKKGDVYVALVNNLNGHDFVVDAYANGAVVAVVSQKVNCDIPQIVVVDTDRALWAMGEAQRDWGNATRIAVTGSCGKTTAKEMIAACLQAPKSEGSFNNHWGVPLSLARTPKDAQYAVYEIGMNHPGEIAPLACLVRPQVAVVTNVAPVHIGAFASEAEIAVEKLSIREGFQHEGSILVTGHDVYTKYSNFFDEKPVTFSISNHDADVFVESVSLGLNGQTVVASVMGEVASFHLKQSGEPSVINALCALAVTKALGGNLQRAVMGLEAVEPVTGRGNITQCQGITVIDESYNANPASMRAALSTLKQRPMGGRKIAILGQMGELGEQSASFHADLAAHCQGLDMVILVGEDMKHLYRALPASLDKYHYNRADEVNTVKFARQLIDGDVVMVKGSKTVLWNYKFVPHLVDALHSQQSIGVTERAV